MTILDLPEIIITRNIRSTRLRLRVEPHQIRLTAPVFCTNKQIQNFITQSEGWLIKTWQAQQEQKSKIDQTLPEKFSLFNQHQPIKVFYREQKNNYNFDADSLILNISHRNPEQYLKAFVLDYAKLNLPQFIEQIAQECNLSFGKISIRQPKTRWGSCTAKHDIMLNGGLVLFSKEIVRYVCVHELAHTQHFDHSAAFWSLVEKHDLNYKVHRRILKTTPMPYWWYNK